MGRNGSDTDGKDVTKSKRASAASGKDAEFRGYINLELTTAEKEKYPKWATPATVFAVFDAAVASGVNVATKPDPRNDGFLASATQRATDSPNAGLCVTARAKDAVTAFGRLMFMLDILSRDESWETTQKVAQPDRW